MNTTQDSTTTQTTPTNRCAMPTSSTPTITLTEKAAQQVSQLVGDQGQAKGLRLFVEAGGCSGMSYGMELNSRQEGDVECNQHNVKLFVDEAAMTYLKGSVIDYVDGLTGAGFKITNPNAKHTCGCGNSFEA